MLGQVSVTDPHRQLHLADEWRDLTLYNFTEWLSPLYKD